MKLHTLAMTILGTLLVCTAFSMDCSNASESASGASVLGVDNYMKNSEKYPGSVGVEGVVSQIISDQHMVIIIDTEEYEKCKSVTCSLLRLPVFWEGKLPKVYDIVRVKGEVGKRGEKRLFVAKELKRVGQVNAKK